MSLLGEGAELQCPTCGARQQPQPECRRCKSDLQLYCSALEDCERYRRRALRQCARANYVAAARSARRYHELAPCADSRRLLAVTNLMAGDFDAALALHAELARDESPED